MHSMLKNSDAKNSLKDILSQEPDSRIINIVFASDNKYIPYTVTTLASILKNYNGEQNIHVYFLLDHSLSNQHLANIEELKKIKDFNFSCINVDASQFEGIKTSEGISIATYYRLLMHDILPDNVEKALYLDSDLIINDSIDGLYNISFDGNLFAGVEDSISIDYNRKFGIPATGKHINAGVLLLNLNMIRQFNFLERIMNFIDKNRFRITLGDQQILCELFFDLIKYVPVKWNVHGSMFQENWVENYVDIKNNMSRKDAINAIKKPGIIHYTLKRKPWMSLQHPKSELWFDYLKYTKYNISIDKPKPEAANHTVKDKRTELNNTPHLKIKNNSTKANKITAPRFIKKILPGYLLSLKKIRTTRLLVDDIVKKYNEFIDHVSTGPSNSKSPTPLSIHANNIGQPTGKTTKIQKRKNDLDIKLKTILTNRARMLPNEFDANKFIQELPENLKYQSNLVGRDVDGGQNENLKSIFKSSDLLYEENKKSDAVIIHALRTDQGMFWDSIEHAYLYDKTIIFTEVNFFSAFASFYDTQATLEQRRAVGFILDDMGYYYDARQPSRLETILNSPFFNINEEELARTRSLIETIVKNKITKYNKYTSSKDKSWKTQSESILVVEQKMNDASIIFSDGHISDFQRMIEDACKSNPTKTIYFKRHPDNILSNKENGLNLRFDNLVVVPEHIAVTELIDDCSHVYTVSSQVGFEALIRGKKVTTYGKPFYSGWGLTDDKHPLSRRVQKRTIEEIFYVACIKLSVYFDASSNKLITPEESLNYILRLKDKQ